MNTDQVASRPALTVPARTGISLLALGIAFDVAVNGQTPGLSIPGFVGLLALSVRAYGARDRETDALLAASVVVSVFPAIHSTLVVSALDVGAAAALVGLAAARGEGSVVRASLLSLIRRGFALAESALRVPFAVLTTIAAGLRRLAPERVRAALRLVLIVVPVLAIFTGLLASADRVFGRIVFPHVKLPDLSGGVVHVALFFVGTAGATTLWIASRHDGSSTPPARERAPAIRFSEWALVLGGINMLYLLFDIVQFAVLFGGNRRVQVTPGLTYAVYARSGFFQLIAVSILTLFLIVGVWDMGKREDGRHQRIFAASVAGMIALTGVILVSAFVRLTLYQHAFGFTIQRLLAYAVIVWIALVLLGVLGAIARGTRDRVMAMIIATGLGVLIGLNAIEPGRFVAQRNAARFVATGKLDTQYLPSIGFDSVPVAVSLLRSLPKDMRNGLRASLCDAAAQLARHHDIRSANLARTRAREALEKAGITTKSCR